MAKVLCYIEEHLKDELSNAALAEVAGYSEYHFLRVFKDVVNLTPADYIRKRRISEIAARMVSQKGTIAELAFEYGFNSKENFLRAFKTEHHILPTEYKAVKNSLKLYPPIRLQEEPFRVEVRLEELAGFRLVVYRCDEDFPPRFWNRYNAGGWSVKLSGGAVVEDFGVSEWDICRSKLNYYIGIKQEFANGDLTGTEVLDVPQGLYAIFDTPKASQNNFVDTIHRTWDYIARIWLPESGFRRTGGLELESYVEQSREFSERIYIPVIPNVE